MELTFWKYQGTGNDFVMIDDRNQTFDEQNHELIALLCHRRFGIGADGLILLRNEVGYDFKMLYFNANGHEGSMCGNGGRCTVAFAKALGIFETSCHFIAVDGPHDASVNAEGIVDLKMIDVSDIEVQPNYMFMNTGSPHYVEFVTAIKHFDVVGKGRAIRYNERFKEKGTNVNFVETTHNGIQVATYERGVEDETLACGTGVTAAAIAFHKEYMLGTDGRNINIPIVVKGGFMNVRFDAINHQYSNIWLCGPALKVFFGKVEI